jgi:membrane fusion protein (multidrug efflux system)
LLKTSLLKKMMLILVLPSLLFSCKAKKKEENAPKSNIPNATIVDVIIASTSSVANTIEVNGTVIPRETVNINPELSGRLVYLNAPDGAKVSQGAILAKVNDADLQATNHKTKVLLEMAQKTEERLKKLLSINGINQADYDMALNQVNSLKADLAVTQAQIDKTILRAPFSGVLGLRQISAGAYITPATIITTLQQVDQVKIDFNVPEFYTNLIKTGMRVSIQTNESNTKRIARIVATDPQINTTTRNLRVRALLEGAAIAPGTFVKVLLESGRGKKTIMVPTNAIIPDARAKKLIVVKNGEGVFIEVETGLRGTGLAEITSGIHEGDSIVVTGVLFVRPKQPVKIRSIKQLNEIVKQ